MGICELCSKETELLDGIYCGKMVKVCRNCMRINDVVLISKPTAAQLSGVKEYKVKDRLMQLANLYDRRKEKHAIEAKIKRKTEGSYPNAEVVKRAREGKGLTQEKLAEEIGESAGIIEDIEKGIKADEKVIKKLEQYLRIKLAKEEEREEEEPDSEKRVFKNDGSIDFRSRNVTIGDLKKIEEE